jgi:hypothetical protein
MPLEFPTRGGLRASVRHVGRERQPVLIIDEFLPDPDSLLNFAAGQARFAPSGTLYPGLTAPPPPIYAQGVLNSLGGLLATTFGVSPRSARLASSFMGIVTTPAEQLNAMQRLPHVDQPDSGQIAILHYLCDDRFGGTAFYRHRATGYEALDSARMREVGDSINRDLAAHGPMQAGYVSGSNRIFQQTAAVYASYNRLVAYRSQLLHSGLIPPGAPLHPAPQRGRLTINLFARFSPLADVA